MDSGTEHNELDTKIVLLGDSGVGKTSLVMRYVQGTFVNDQHSTIGASFMTKRMFVDDWKIKLQIWDTAGQERFKSMTPMYYRGAHAAILVYDVSQSASFDSVKDWVRELNTNLSTDIVIAIAANKSDLVIDENKIPSHMPLSIVKEYAQSIDALLFQTSAKEDKGIEDIFFHVAKKMLNDYLSKTKGTPISTSESLRAIEITNKKKREGCCTT